MSHVLLVFGSSSPEHDVTLVSAKNIYSVLKETSITTSLIGLTKENQWKLINGDDLLTTNFTNPLNLDLVGRPIKIISKNSKLFLTSLEGEAIYEKPIDIAFPVIHGPFGEDGQLQKELNEIGLEFVGSDSLSCKNSFDKAITKELIAKTEVLQVPYKVFEGDLPHFSTIAAELGLPFFIKPANMGSSIGISKVSSESEYAQAFLEAKKYDNKILMEKNIAGREIECALLDNQGLKASGLGEVKPNHDFYSYEAKYIDPNGAELIIPATLSPDIAEEIKTMALRCFKALGCRDYSRADFFLTDNNKIFFNEINTYPGFTSISQFPLLWQQEGMDYKELILHLIENALHRLEKK